MQDTGTPKFTKGPQKRRTTEKPTASKNQIQKKKLINPQILKEKAKQNHQGHTKTTRRERTGETEQEEDKCNTQQKTP